MKIRYDYTRKEVESVIKNLTTTKQSPDPDGFPSEFLHKLKKDIPILHEQIKKKHFSTHFTKNSIMFIPKPDKCNSRRKFISRFLS